MVTKMVPFYRKYGIFSMPHETTGDFGLPKSGVNYSNLGKRKNR